MTKENVYYYGSALVSGIVVFLTLSLNISSSSKQSSMDLITYDQAQDYIKVSQLPHPPPKAINGFGKPEGYYMTKALEDLVGNYFAPNTNADVRLELYVNNATEEHVYKYSYEEYRKEFYSIGKWNVYYTEQGDQFIVLNSTHTNPSPSIYRSSKELLFKDELLFITSNGLRGKEPFVLNQ